MNEWRNGTAANTYRYRHFLNWNKTEHVDYNQVAGGAGAAAGTLRNVAPGHLDTTVDAAGLGGILTQDMFDNNVYNYEKKYIDIVVKEGWSYIVWNFYNNATIDSFKV